MQVSQNILPLAAAEMLPGSLISVSSGMNTQAPGFSETLVTYMLNTCYYQPTRTHVTSYRTTVTVVTFNSSVRNTADKSHKIQIATMIARNFIAEFLRRELSHGHF